ncbi:hypothetical protein HYW99_03350 [Candidatus Woesearchaeota archaeon]|nr:hypothetical protein [Candidatus Woesearchaeota archaeon]
MCTRKLHAIFKKKGFRVSLRKISQVLVKEGFQKPCLKRRKPRKYKRYEWPIPNYMEHTDWHVIKAKKLKVRKYFHILDTEFDERFETIDDFIENLFIIITENLKSTIFHRKVT